jgi:glycosyltransferase involved in cell wall biosynthesis
MIDRFDPFSHVGGTQTLDKNLSLELSKLGHEVHVVCGSLKNTNTKTESSVALHPIYCIDVKYLGGLHYFFKMQQFLKKNFNKFDVVICHDFTGGIASLGIGQSTPLIYYAHDVATSVFKMLSYVPLRRRIGYIPFMRYLMFAEKNVCRKADLTIAIAKCVKEDLCENYKISPKKIMVNYHGLPSNFNDGIKASFPHMPSFLHIATDHQRKGTKYLLQAMGILQKKYAIKANAIIVGKKDPYYVNLAIHLAVSVNFVGKVSEIDLKRLYASCTCLVVPSIREGFCLPVIEASSFGKPVIVTNAGALPELVKDGVDGFVVPVADADSLAEKMYVLVTDAQLRKKMSFKAKEKARKFGIDATAKKLICAINYALQGEPISNE